MSSPIKIPLTESQKNLLQRDEISNLVEQGIRDSISTISSIDDSYVFNLSVRELFYLIDTIHFVSFHETNNPQWVEQLDDLSAYLEMHLDEE
jgi:hypothetical protein